MADITEMKKAAHERLDSYLLATGGRRTVERSSLLDAVFDIGHIFTIPEIQEKLSDDSMPLSVATLYSGLELFCQLGFIVKHPFDNATKYEPVLCRQLICYEVCDMCGKVKIINSPALQKALLNVNTRFFKKSYGAVYMHGTCQMCAKAAKKTEKIIKERYSNGKR